LVYPFKTEQKGWGLAAGEPIPKGSFIMQYVGEVFTINSPLGKKRLSKNKNSTCTYLM
jgi:SET domain-containing protein